MLILVEICSGMIHKKVFEYLQGRDIQEINGKKREKKEWFI
jgi:hypothetical protein